MDRRADQQTYLAFEMQFYISVMFLGPPDDIHEEKPFLQFEKKKRITDRPTNERTDRPPYSDARMHLKSEEKKIIFHQTKMKMIGCKQASN